MFLALTLGLVPASAQEQAAPAMPGTPPAVPHGPMGGQAGPMAGGNAEASAGMNVVPTVEGYPAGRTLPLVFLLRLPQGMTMLVPPAPGAPDPALELAVVDGGGITLTDLALIRPPADGLVQGRAVAAGRLGVDAGVSPGEHRLKGGLSVTVRVGEGKSERITAAFDLPVQVLAQGAPVKVVSPQMLARLGVPLPDTSAATVPAAEEPDPFSDATLLWMLLAAFGIGLGLNLTPCVYPMIPLTVSFFGGRAGLAPRARLFGAVAYWAGITAMYTVLGTFASLTGNFLGEWLTNPWVLLGLAAVLVAMAASMFGLWEIRMPGGLNRAAAANRAGVGGAFIMGLTAGVLAAPCAGPAVVGLMTHVAKVGHLGYGMASFFLLAAGLGLPLAVLAYFSELLSRLPGAGDWMVWVRKFFGVVLVLMALSIVRPLMGDETFRWLMAGAGVVGGLYLAFLEKSGKGGFLVFKRVVGVLLILAGVLFWWLTAPPPGQGHITWTPYTPAAMAKAAADKKPAVVDFGAEWCAPCRQLEDETFSDPRVQKAMAGFVPLRVDVTKGGNAEDKALMRSWMVRGVPTVVFIAADGKPLHELTLIGFEGPDAFLARMNAALAKSKR